ncbi:MAG: sodium:proline symporter, partial [Romboutsia sp.]|nr:sodium:proline symporter [Romboutsia sp.]
MSGPITALSAGASDMSSWLLMALPGGIYSSGLRMVWMPVSLIVGAFCNWKFVAKRLRIYTEIATNSLTIPAYFSNRFCCTDKSLRLVLSLSIIVFFTFYCVAGFVSGTVLIQMIFTTDYFTSLAIISSVIIAYILIGGFLAVSWV